MAATSRGHSVAGVHQQFQPFAEALRVETLVVARLSAPPQIEVEDGRELGGCRRRDDLAADVEPAAPIELLQRLGRKVGHDSRKLRRVHQAREEPASPGVESTAPCEAAAPAAPRQRAGFCECGAGHGR